MILLTQAPPEAALAILAGTGILSLAGLACWALVKLSAWHDR